MNRTSQGFSLPEILITLGLIALLLSISIPEPKSNNARLNRIVLSIEELIERARGLALYHEQKIKLAIEPNTLTLTGKNISIQSTTLPQTISLESSSNAIYFHPDGISTPSYIQVRLKEQHCKLTISLFGRVTTACT